LSVLSTFRSEKRRSREVYGFVSSGVVGVAGGCVGKNEEAIAS
jgi:hypothetical protein